MAGLTRSFLTTGGMMMGRWLIYRWVQNHHQHLSRSSQHMFTPLVLLGWGKKRHHRTHLLQTSGWCQRLPQNVCPLRFSPHNSHTRSGNQAAMNSLLLFQIIKLFVSAGVVHLEGCQRYVLCWCLRCLRNHQSVSHLQESQWKLAWILVQEHVNQGNSKRYGLPWTSPQKAPSLSTRKKYPIHWIREFLWGNVVPYNKKRW